MKKKELFSMNDSHSECGTRIHPRRQPISERSMYRTSALLLLLGAVLMGFMFLSGCRWLPEMS